METNNLNGEKPPRRWGRTAILVSGAVLLLAVWLLDSNGLSLLIANGPGGASLRMGTEREIAEAGVTNVVAALVTIMSDTRVESLRDCFRNPDNLERESITETMELHTTMVYELLRHGSRADLELQAGARAGLYQGYIDLGADPWGNPYYVYLGDPAPSNANRDTAVVPWRVNEGTTQTETSPGTAPPFVAWPRVQGNRESNRPVPAPANLPFYVICAGPNGKLDQPFLHDGVTPASGDDLTSWDGYAYEVTGNRQE